MPPFSPNAGLPAFNAVSGKPFITLIMNGNHDLLPVNPCKQPCLLSGTRTQSTRQNNVLFPQEYTPQIPCAPHRKPQHVKKRSHLHALVSQKNDI